MYRSKRDPNEKRNAPGGRKRRNTTLEVERACEQGAPRKTAICGHGGAPGHNARPRTRRHSPGGTDAARSSSHPAAGARPARSPRPLAGRAGRARAARAALGRPPGDGAALLGIARASLGEPTAALALYRESAALARASGDAWLEAYTLTNQGAAAVLVGDSSAADGLYRASLALFSRLDDPWGRGIALRGLAGMADARC